MVIFVINRSSSQIVEQMVPQPQAKPLMILVQFWQHQEKLKFARNAVFGNLGA